MVKTITAIILGIIAVFLILYLPLFAFKCFVLLVIFGLLAEYSKLFFKDRFERYSTVFLGTVLSVLSIFVVQEKNIIIPLILLILFSQSCFFMWRTKVLDGVFNRLAISLFSILYLVLPLCMWVWLRDSKFGTAWILLTVAASVLSDAFAYIFGKTIGRHKIAPLVSPNKTIEGFLGALVGSLIGTFVIYAFFFKNVLSTTHFFIIAIAIWVLAPLGDLVESMIKRSINVKDTGTLIPGHGGLLDRFDALIFTGPFVYMYVVYVM